MTSTMSTSSTTPTMSTSSTKLRTLFLAHKCLSMSISTAMTMLTRLIRPRSCSHRTSRQACLSEVNMLTKLPCIAIMTLRTLGSDLLVYYSWLVDAGSAITMNRPTLPPRPPAPIFQRELRTLLVEPTSISDIDPQHKQWMQKTMLMDWSICSPHDFQMKAIHEAVFFLEQMVYVCAKNWFLKVGYTPHCWISLVESDYYSCASCWSWE
jgi:hypothetical protein